MDRLFNDHQQNEWLALCASPQQKELPMSDNWLLEPTILNFNRMIMSEEPIGAAMRLRDWWNACDRSQQPSYADIMRQVVMEYEHDVRRLERQIKEIPTKNISMPCHSQLARVADTDVYGPTGPILPPTPVPEGDYVLLEKNVFLRLCSRAAASVPQPVPLVPPKAPEVLSITPPTPPLVSPFQNIPEPERVPMPSLGDIPISPDYRPEDRQLPENGCKYDDCRRSESPYCQCPNDCRGDKPIDPRDPWKGFVSKTVHQASAVDILTDLSKPVIVNLH